MKDEGEGGRHMNPLDRLLRDEMNRLLDRLGASTKRGVGTASARHLPELRDRLDAAEARLTAARQTLLAQYEEWQGALGACEDLWALAQLELDETDRKSTRLNSSHDQISYAVFCLK